MSHKTHSHMPGMSGYVNTDNCHFWAPNNPRELHQLFPHSEKVTVWCAIPSHGIIGPFLWNCGGAYSDRQCRAVQSHTGTIIAKYVSSFVSLICCVSKRTEQTTQTALISMQIPVTFPGRLISHFGDIIWPIQTWSCSTKTTSFQIIKKAKYTKRALPIQIT